MPYSLTKRFVFSISSIIATTCVLANTAPTQMTVAPMLKQVMPSVVKIFVEKNKPTNHPVFKLSDPAPEKEMGIGTGTIIDAKQGLIVTNAHVVKDTSQMIVTLNNGARYYGHVVATAPDDDIAVVHIDASHLHAIKMASIANVHAGDFVAAVGTPYDLSQTVTTGTISALNRAALQIGKLDDLIQTDAAINPGNSGGPLVNMSGQMVGMNTAKLNPDISSGLGFAIPVDVVKAIAHQLIEYGNVKQGMLGTVVQPLTESLAQSLNAPVSSGTLITQVMPQSAAANINLHAGDIVTAIDHIPVKSASQVKTLVSLHRPNTQVSITYWHHGKEHTKVATLESMEQSFAHTPDIPFVAGLQLQNLTALSSTSDNIKGLLVSHVGDHSAGLLAGIMPGDVIMELNSKKCSSITKLKQILSLVPTKQTQILVKLYRDGKFMYTTLNR